MDWRLVCPSTVLGSVILRNPNNECNTKRRFPVVTAHGISLTSTSIQRTCYVKTQAKFRM